MVVWFLAAFDIGPDVSIGYTGLDTARPPTAVVLTTSDGSWAEISITATADGEHEVAEGGPRRLWQAVERAHRQWARLDRPGWNRFGLTVTADTQTLWLDRPETVLRTWPTAAGGRDVAAPPAVAG